MSKHRQEQRREKQRRHAQTQREIARKAEKSGPEPTKIHRDEISVSSRWKSFGPMPQSVRIGVDFGDLQNMSAVWEWPTEPPQEEPAPTFSQCVIGYRQWVIDALGQLRAFTMFKQIWKPGVNEAICRPTDTISGNGLWNVATTPETHQAPHVDCECGLYGWNDLAPPIGGCANLDAIGRVIVYGAIAAWGDLRVHATGFRASHACLVALAYDDDTEPRVLDLLLRVADEYRVKLVHVDALQAEAEQHGMLLPDDARPPAADMWSFFHSGIAQTIRIAPAQWNILPPT